MAWLAAAMRSVLALRLRLLLRLLRRADNFLDGFLDGRDGRALDARLDLSLVQDDEGGDGAHGEALRDVRVLIDVDVVEAHGRVVVAQERELRCDGLAGATPFRCELDDNNRVRAELHRVAHRRVEHVHDGSGGEGEWGGADCGALPQVGSERIRAEVVHLEWNGLKVFGHKRNCLKILQNDPKEKPSD